MPLTEAQRYLRRQRLIRHLRKRLRDSFALHVFTAILAAYVLFLFISESISA